MKCSHYNDAPIQAESPTACKAGTPIQRRYRKWQKKRGQVVSITGDYQGLTTEYVRDIGYDEYAQRVFIEYGNGTKTEYTYDKTRRWL